VYGSKEDEEAEEDPGATIRMIEGG